MAEIYLDIVQRAQKFVDANKQARAEVVRTEQKVKESNQKMQAGFEKTSLSLRNVAASLGIAFGAAQVLNYIRNMANESIKFEKSLAQVYTQLTAIEKVQFKGPLREGALEIMAKYGLTMDEVTTSMFEALSAGVKVSEVLDFVDESARLAVGGVAALDVVTDAATSVMNAYGYSVKELTKISNAFFVAQLYGKTTVEKLAQEIGTILPVARAAGVGYQELLAAFGLLTKQGINTAETATALRATLVALAAPSREAEVTFKNLGIETGLVALKQNGLGKTLLQVALASEDNADVLTELIPNVRALSAVAALGTGALAEYDKILQEINEDTGEGSRLTQAYNEINATTDQTLKRLTATIKAAWLQSDALNASTKVLTFSADALADDLNKDKGIIKTILKWNKEILLLYGGTIPQAIKGILGLMNADKELSEQINISKDSFDEQTQSYIARIKAAQAKSDIDKEEIETITSLKLELADLQKARDAMNVRDTNGIRIKNNEIKAIQEQIKALEDLGKTIEIAIIKPIKDEDISIKDLLGLDEDFDFGELKKMTQDFADEQLGRYEDEADIQIAFTNKVKQAKEQGLYEIANTAMMLTDLSMAKSQNAMDQELMALEEKHKKELISDEAFEIQSDLIRRKYAREQQKIAIRQATMDGATAIMKIFAQWAGTPFAFIFAAIQAMQTALQISTIKAQKFSKGVLDLKGPGSETSDSIPSMLSRRESVMTAKETKDYYPYLKAMKDGTFPRFDMDLAKKFEKNTYNNLNYDNSKEIKELRTIAGLLKNRKSEVEFIQGGQRVIKKGNVTTRINLN